MRERRRQGKGKEKETEELIEVGESRLHQHQVLAVVKQLAGLDPS